MKPKKLLISNFMILASLEVDFEQFSSAIVVARINGDTRKSNGGGKSTVSHALNYVLFDLLPVSPLEKAIREGQDAMSVTLEFETEAGILYRISRSRRRKAKQAEIKLEKWDDQWKDQSQKTNSETEKEIQKLLGFNFEILRHTNFFGQSDLSGLFSAKTSSARRSIFGDLFFLDIYSALEKNIQQKKIKELEQEVNLIEKQVLSQNISENEILELRSKIKILEDKKENYSFLLENAENSIFDWQEKIAQQKLRLSSGIEKKISLLEEKKKEQNSWQKKKNYSIQIIEEKNKFLPTCLQQITEKRKEIEKLEQGASHRHLSLVHKDENS